jgi:hypothetical protein
MHAVQLPRPRDRDRRQEPSSRATLIAAIRSSGSISLDAKDPAGRTAAAKLAVAGLLAIEEIGTDGRLRRLTPADVLMASSRFDWRVTIVGARA